MKKVEITSVDGSIRRFEKVRDNSFERKDSFLRFKNDKGEVIFFNIDKILMFSVEEENDI